MYGEPVCPETLQNKVLSNQNKGHLGYMYKKRWCMYETYVYVQKKVLGSQIYSHHLVMKKCIRWINVCNICKYTWLFFLHTEVVFQLPEEMVLERNATLRTHETPTPMLSSSCNYPGSFPFAITQAKTSNRLTVRVSEGWSALTVPEERWTLNKTCLFGLSLRIQIYSVSRFWGGVWILRVICRGLYCFMVLYNRVLFLVGVSLETNR